jgi:thiol-disulfide isomerase/thioredoxin
MMNKRFLIVAFVIVLVLSACTAPTPASVIEAMVSATPEAMMASKTPDAKMASKTPDAMMSSATPAAMMASTPDAMMASKTPEVMMASTTPDAMVSSSTASAMMGTETPGAMMASTPDAMMISQTPAAMMGTPNWFSTSLTDVSTGKNFTVAGFQGKVVLVETIATWCPNCLDQQKQIQAYLNAAGMNDQLVVISLDIDMHEDSALLKSYEMSNSFKWTHAVAPASVANEIGTLYGDQFLNPTATPILIVDKKGTTHLLPFGLKNADALKKAIDSYLGM